jgi:hypothetical protein
MKNRAPYVLAGVAVLTCDDCNFLCSDARYLAAHNSVEHQTVPENPDELANGDSKITAQNEEFIRNIKQVLKNSADKKREIESAIESTSKTLGSLYAALLSDSANTVDEATKIIERVTPLGSGENSEAITSESVPVVSPTNITPHYKIALSPPETTRKRKLSIEHSDEMTSLNLNETEPTGHLNLPVFNGMNRFGANLSDMERAQAIIETIKRARLGQQDRIEEDEDEEDVVVQPGPPVDPLSEQGSNNTQNNVCESDSDEIIEIPIDESDDSGLVGMNTTPMFNPKNGLHHLINQTNTANNQINRR